MDNILGRFDHPLVFFLAVTLIAIAGPIALAAVANAAGFSTIANVARPGAGGS